MLVLHGRYRVCNAPSSCGKADDCGPPTKVVQSFIARLECPSVISLQYGKAGSIVASEACIRMTNRMIPPGTSQTFQKVRAPRMTQAGFSFENPRRTCVAGIICEYGRLSGMF